MSQVRGSISLHDTAKAGTIFSLASNRIRLSNAAELDVYLRAAVRNFDLADLLARFDTFDAAVAPVYDVAQTFEDPQFKARENVVSVPDDELGGPVRMQNVVGKLSRTPGRIRSAGPKLGEHNREILVDGLGFTADELAAAGIAI